MTLNEIREEYRKIWGDLPVGPLCLGIIDFVASTPPEELHFLTFKTLSTAVGKDGPDYDVLAAVTILTSSRLAIFDAHAMLVDDDETEHELTPEEFAEAKRTGTLIHPETGSPVADFESHVVPFFAPTDAIYRELSHG
ncbi:hypothetical protein JOH50_004855 [Rhizobium leguminosarum]|uniref:hypothetical protein n=1 Tax=Rhizobium leguminosarum TaxID=384 RepID=UPI001AE7C3BE|nr:hypothetical protein [Rhizobium leguminosarum]MBP2489128.1 hypothetical protein [Rhizobium leguminosarum]